ncbi:ABC transporter permease [Phytoactinopolyspora halotolerans]|nr:ABC transporter permease [Phytoactinopolyspora halotolerans]
MMARFLIALGNEVRKGLRFAWSERLQILIELPMFGVFILLLGPLLGQGGDIAAGEVEWTLDSETTSILLVWFIPFIFFYMQVVKMFWRLLAEIQAGTIEQVYLSPLPSWLVAAAGRVVAAFLETLVVAAGTFAIVAPFVPIRIDWNAAALLPAAMVMLAGIGFSLIIAGATLVWKRIQLVNDTVLTVVMLFSASAIPLIEVPDWWADASHALPLTDSVGSLYTALFTGESITSLWGIGGLVPLLVVSFAYLGAGILAFGLGERTAKRRGTLGSY